MAEKIWVIKEMVDVAKKMSSLVVAEGSQSRTQEVGTLTEIAITIAAGADHHQSSAGTVIEVESCLAMLLPIEDQIARRMFTTTTLLLGWISILNHRELIVVVD